MFRFCYYIVWRFFKNISCHFFHLLDKPEPQLTQGKTTIIEKYVFFAGICEDFLLLGSKDYQEQS